MKAKISWDGEARFLAETESHHTVLMDGPPEHGGKNSGPRPMEMMLMGEPISADRAMQMGLVTRMVDPDELLPEIHRMAEHLASFAPFVPHFMKAMVHEGMEGSLKAALAMEKFAQGALVQTQDKEEGISAFLEKRKPTFEGR